MNSRVRDHGQGFYVEPSPAIASLFETINRMASDYRSPNWDYLLINASTLFRNNLSKDLNQRQVIDESGLDSSVIKGAIRNYWRKNPKSPKRLEIIEYIPNYAALPLLFKRTESKANAQVHEIVKYVRKFVEKESAGKPVKEPDDLAPTTILNVGSSVRYPHQDLLQYIHQSRQNDKSFLGMNHLRVAMISHCPIDWHIGFYFKQFHLLESFTGNVRDLSMLGEKLFKDKFIPFNRATHVLFGDNVHVKPMALRKNKQLILDVAQKHKWYSKSESSIIDDIVRTLSVPKTLITSANF